MTDPAFFKRLAKQGEQRAESVKRDQERAEAILQGCNPVQRRFLLDTSSYKSLRCPRRAGKSFALTSNCLYLGEKFPGKRFLVLSLTLKTTRENFWTGAPGGIFRQSHTYGLNLKFNHTDMVWIHENGSRGRIAGAETRADIEHLRGAAAEADLVVVDECKSFAPEHLDELIRDVLEPGLMTRDGILVLAGTPGQIPIGPFYDATSPSGGGTCVPYDGKPLDLGWSLHTWSIQDNKAAPNQWKRALKIKAERKWADDHPSWRREYLGEWATDSLDLVYSYAKLRSAGEVTWHPQPSKDCPTGLPAELGPWHLVMGLDFGWEDDCALVLFGWSERVQELRQVYEFKSPHLTVDEFAEEIARAIDTFGQPDVITADASGKQIIETLNQRYGWGVVPAKRQDKNDFIELLNSDFHAGRIKVIGGSDWERELCGLQWDLSANSKAELARTGKLREDSSCPNHLCDAALYAWRYAYHFWSSEPQLGPERGTPAWYDKQEELAIEKANRRHQAVRGDPFGFKELQRADRKLGEHLWRTN